MKPQEHHASFQYKPGALLLVSQTPHSQKQLHSQLVPSQTSSRTLPTQDLQERVMERWRGGGQPDVTWLEGHPAPVVGV